MIIDRKFKIVAVNPCNLHRYTEENAVLFAAKDSCLPAALRAYLTECVLQGAGDEHIESLQLLLTRVEEYQATIEKRLPDTNLPCEVDRCIGGIL